MRVLVSGGPTREYLDDVRYLGNASTGAMGIAVAEAARDRGHAVVLVLGPTHLCPPGEVRTVRVESALEMRAALVAELPAADALVMTAAVADHRPRRRFPGKPPKGSGPAILELVKNPDILAELATMSADRPVVGFALEAGSPDEALASARDKLRRKRCDLIVVNRPASLGSSHGVEVSLVSEAAVVPLGHVRKQDLALRLVRFLEERAVERGGPSRKHR